MQITLVLDGVAPNSIILVPLDCLTFIRKPSSMAAILQYGGHAQFLIFYYSFNFETPPFYSTAARANFKYNLIFLQYEGYF